MTSNNIKTTRTAMIFGGLALYFLSFILPAMQTKVWESQERLTGLGCLFWGTIMGIISLISLNVPLAFICLFSNGLMAISILVLLTRVNSGPLSILMLAEAALIFLAAIIPDAFGLNGTKFLYGYFVWCVSFTLIGTALALTHEQAGKTAAKSKNGFRQVAIS
ncbi:MAG: hypothetical protein AB7P14_15720 [Blastocatellales bacterium]